MGFDTFLVMRHGMRVRSIPTRADSNNAAHSTVPLGCYFCNDVVAPADVMVNVVFSHLLRLN